VFFAVIGQSLSISLRSTAVASQPVMSNQVVGSIVALNHKGDRTLAVCEADEQPTRFSLSAIWVASEVSDEDRAISGGAASLRRWRSVIDESPTDELAQQLARPNLRGPPAAGGRCRGRDFTHPVSRAE
jgi:hypothetical protein